MCTKRQISPRNKNCVIEQNDYRTEKITPTRHRRKSKYRRLLYNFQVPLRSNRSEPVLAALKPFKIQKSRIDQKATT